MRGQRKRFREWTLQQTISPLRTRKTVDGNDRWSWSFPIRHGFLEAWRSSLSTERWPVGDCRKALQRVETWWREDGQAVLDEYEATHDLGEAVRDRLDTIDECLAMTADGGALDKLIESGANEAWFADFLRTTLGAGVPLIRTRYSLTSHQTDATIAAARLALAKQFTTALNDTGSFTAGNLMS